MTPESSGNDAVTPATGGAAGDSKPANTNDNKRYRRRGQRKPMTTERPTTKQPKFEGKCEDLKGHIYDCSDSRQSDMSVKTTKEIAEYVGRTFRCKTGNRKPLDAYTGPTIRPDRRDKQDPQPNMGKGGRRIREA